tara:strand:- start:179 stop:1990 length:1812 start_codon:yes stop_codon:yes gene_type:complete
MIAILEDGGTARLGTAQYFQLSQTYRLVEGNLEMPLSARGSDGVFRLDSGQYQILTPSQHVELKKQETMAAAAAAQVAIAPKPPIPMPTEQMASLTLHPPTPQPTACGLHSQISTVIALGPSNIGLAAARSEQLANVARMNNNVVTHVVLGVASEADARAALALPTPRVFLAGANEMRALSDRSSHGATRKYLEEAVLLATVANSALTNDASDEHVLWLLPDSHVPLDGTLGALEQREHDGKARSLTIYQLALNTQWKEWYARYNGTAEPLDAKEEALLRAYTSFPVRKQHPPLGGIMKSGAAIVGASSGVPVGIVDRTITWTENHKASTLWPMPALRWVTTGAPSRDGSVYWAVATWCHNTKAVLRTPSLLLDHQLSFEDLQYDVTQVLATMLMHTLPGGSQPYRKGISKMKGVVGPVVLAGRSSNEPMRVTYWTLEGAPTVTMILPEAYVQEVLRDYNTVSKNSPMLSARGFLVLPRADEVPIVFSGLSDAELDSERSLFGARLWIQGTARAAVVVDLPPVPVRALVTYRTQLDANTTPSNLILQGARVYDDAAAQVYHVATTSEDQLCGLRVCWSNVDNRPILDVDTYQGGAQLPYESVP